MLLNILLYVVIGYVMYRLTVARNRWRIVRVITYVPIMVIVWFTLSFFVELNTVNAIPTAADIENLIVDEMVVERGNLRVTVSTTGAIQPLRQVPLTFSSVGQIGQVNAIEGQSVAQGDVIATLDTTDLEQFINDATIALDLQKSAFNALTEPAREVDIASAQAALNAARAQYYAASATGPTSQQEEIARLQSELAVNQAWQVSIQRDLVVVPDTTTFTIPNITLQPIDTSGLGGLPPDVLDAINDFNNQVDQLNSSLNSTLDGAGALLDAQTLALQNQRNSLEASIDDAYNGAAIAEANYQSTLLKGPDTGALASANAGIIQAQIALDRLVNGPSDIELAQSNTSLQLAQNALDQAKVSLTNSQLVAPFDGVIAQNNLTVGELPPQGIAVLLMDTSGYLVDLPVDETDIVRVTNGQPVVFNVDALPEDEVTGVIERIAYTPLRIGQLVTYNVRVRLNPTSVPLRVGMSVTANIITQERNDVLLVRNRFIRIDNISQDAFVTVQDPDGNFREVMVILGERNDSVSEVISGLDDGVRLVLLPRGTEGVQGIFGGAR